ncbi:Adenylate and Guanylate cyclase catalytic domain containing protein [Trichomonas vaginalis G3]|uniref:Adenylate and Guanylate cyclase catalytic domain containing protein n=1 Tax=Trichomonas vaginalis (strain ATCC PRA-98 / G3) TaxID=412133 RepID=A2EFT4_TRIV3|nr:guanylate cyclase protein [Trichomonas vaginalis G3]EAY08485.1 Adenylate and Guanylate cyclase catalytic domain containing protein [Trichomonas vaginalis G3]KAI5537758.1 guanylate cyclase protein [Trichomonas vaginalis G3]|eukprot:XP_001320708.1 Adenylate and Guanylate cyclase catalytic domain containing protein [Trichomonas vaginalis G3]
MFSVVARIFKIALAKDDDVFKDSVVSIDSEISRMKETIPKVVEYFQNINLGGSDSRQVPFPEMVSIIDVASETLVCPGELKAPDSVTDSVHCFKSDQQYYVATALILKYYSMMQKGVWPSPKDKDLQDLWQIGPIELFQTFFAKAMAIIVPTIISGIENQNKRQIMYTSIFLVLTLLLTIVIILIVKKEDILLKFCLKLLLRCPPQSLLNNARVMDLLGGNYNFTSEDVSDKHVWFSNEVVSRLNDVIIVCQEETSKIITVNTAFEEMFDIKQSEIENKQFKEFFTEERFMSEDKLDKVFSQPITVVFTDKNKNKVYLEFTSSCVSGRRIFSGSNQTQNVMHEKLIADEKKKSDSMLASILPPVLVPRVQAGEKNISFAVKSVTVLFLDVVEFTPWCGSHDAQYVMRMLNIMFKEFDAITNAHKTMTKIKCIGDCYMAAGGIFDEINQPAVHAKEVVDFGCLVIKKLLEIDESENESLRIRVGINTGGSIVAGVIGTEKPTFEILGPAINIAHEMEHHVVPMKVHISRPVYELIYGQSFDIKERGEIDVKGGKMFTYLVEP